MEVNDELGRTREGLASPDCCKRLARGWRHRGITFSFTGGPDREEFCRDS